MYTPTYEYMQHIQDDMYIQPRIHGRMNTCGNIHMVGSKYMATNDKFVAIYIHPSMYILPHVTDTATDTTTDSATHCNTLQHTVQT